MCECKTNNIWIRSAIASCQLPGSESVLWLRKMLHWGKLGEERMAPLRNIFCNFLWSYNYFNIKSWKGLFKYGKHKEKFKSSKRREGKGGREGGKKGKEGKGNEKKGKERKRGRKEGKKEGRTEWRKEGRSYCLRKELGGGGQRECRDVRIVARKLVWRRMLLLGERQGWWRWRLEKY